MKTQSIPFKPQFGAFILETLTLGMYGEARNALREYIQNSFDSLREAIDSGMDPGKARVVVTLHADRLGVTIRDNGLGLRTEAATSVLASVGTSNKDYRRNAGFRGIGRLAGIVFCDTLTFITRADNQTQRTVVVFDAQALRQKLKPRSGNSEDAAATLESCVDAYLEDAADDPDPHYFEVRLEGLFDPPDECTNIAKLRSFLSQIAPVAYDKKFVYRTEIEKNAAEAGFPIETIRVFIADGDGAPHEIFKAYGDSFSVKQVQAELTKVDYVSSPNQRWWGWIGRKRISGAFKDPDVRGIRVRLRNIQIDGTEVMRDIFATSSIPGQPRSSYSRLADWYIGEIFVEPKAAIPNARRDGFEEDQAWKEIRAELDRVVALPYGRQAYKTSKADRLSFESIAKQVESFEREAETYVMGGNGSWDVISTQVAVAAQLQRRISEAVRAADEDELQNLRPLADKVTRLRRELDGLAVEAPKDMCAEEVQKAVSELAQKIFQALRQRLGPSEWGRARDIVAEVSGEEPQ
jgi:hypothetical protein